MPASSGWSLRPAAEDDLSEIWLHGASTWGVEQAERYADGLFAVFDLPAAFPEIARERTEFSPPVRIHASGSPLLIYRRVGGGDHPRAARHQNLTAYLQDG